MPGIFDPGIFDSGIFDIPAGGSSTNANAGNAAGTGSAADATVSTATNTSANAGAATGTGSAGNASVAEAPHAGAAAGTGAAGAPKAKTSISTGSGAGTGSAFNATVVTAPGRLVQAEAALGQGRAFNARGLVEPIAVPEVQPDPYYKGQSMAIHVSDSHTTVSPEPEGPATDAAVIPGKSKPITSHADSPDQWHDETVLGPQVNFAAYWARSRAIHVYGVPRTRTPPPPIPSCVCSGCTTSETFNRTVAAGGLGLSEIDGLPWLITGDHPSSFSVSPSTGLHYAGYTAYQSASLRFPLGSWSYPAEFVTTVTLPTHTGNSLCLAVGLFSISSSPYYELDIYRETGGTTLALNPFGRHSFSEVDGGTLTGQLSGYDNRPIKIRMRVTTTDMYVNVWFADLAEPAGWMFQFTISGTPPADAIRVLGYTFPSDTGAVDVGRLDLISGYACGGSWGGGSGPTVLTYLQNAPINHSGDPNYVTIGDGDSWVYEEFPAFGSPTYTTPSGARVAGQVATNETGGHLLRTWWRVPTVERSTTLRVETFDPTLGTSGTIAGQTVYVAVFAGQPRVDSLPVGIYPVNTDISLIGFAEVYVQPWILSGPVTLASQPAAVQWAAGVNGTFPAGIPVSQAGYEPVSFVVTTKAGAAWLVVSGGGTDCADCDDPANPGTPLPPFTPGFMPTFRYQIGDPTTNLDSWICTLESGAMVLDWQTRGAVKVWGGELIPWCGKTEAQIFGHGTSLSNVRQAWLHWNQYLDVRSGGTWADLIVALQEGRAVILQGDYGVFSTAIRCQDSFEGDHAISVYPYQVGDRLLCGDPLCADFKGIPVVDLQAYAEALGAAIFGTSSPQPILFAVSRPWTP